ncbi:hypothetical protein [Salinisphaera orenii]|uniref:hypothetical protein n=1 Tax=Salinisphaera orenii TaxID=856731 RepID=UPI000F4C4D41|nr:hypothetical protein [Salinisphaera orenii]
MGFHHLAVTGENSAIAIAHQHFFTLKAGQRQLERGAPLIGSRPLALCQANDRIYYGEYRSNDERSPVHIWARRIGGKGWEPVWRFDNVRHVHGVFWDSFADAVWVTTGDTDDESAIWKTTDGFRSLEKVAGGSQAFRAVQLLFTSTAIYYGSDAPDEQNYIYRIHRKDTRVERLRPVAGPVFYGCQVGDVLAFSTVVEPSRVNRSQDAELWVSRLGADWTRLVTHTKDGLSQKYFQYGQILFPAGPGDGRNLWYTPIATDHDEQLFCVPLESL